MTCKSFRILACINVHKLIMLIGLLGWFAKLWIRTKLPLMKVLKIPLKLYKTLKEVLLWTRLWKRKKKINQGQCLLGESPRKWSSFVKSEPNNMTRNLVPRVSLLCLPCREERPWERGWMTRAWDKGKTGIETMTSRTPGGRSIHWATITHGEQGHLTEFKCDRYPAYCEDQHCWSHRECDKWIIKDGEF